jgi:1-phosphofructokinase family hexose kinase
MGLLEDEGVTVTDTEVAGETRSCLTVLSEAPPTVFNESGPHVDDESWSRYETSVVELIEEAGIFAFSGSLPPGAPVEAVARLIERARAADCITICDTSGEYLRAALEAGPDIVKPNLAEALGLLGQEVDESVDVPDNALELAREAAVELRTRGPGAAIVTVGSEGLVYATKGATRAVSSPQIDVVNPIGAGDCFIAGLIAEFQSGADLHEAILTGVAMGAAGCETIPAGLVDPGRVAKLRSMLEG